MPRTQSPIFGFRDYSPAGEYAGNLCTSPSTNEVRNRKALSDANTKLMRSNADLEHFAYSASHDLQEPLRMVSAYAALVRKKFGNHLGPAGDQYIEYILEGARRMERLLHDLRAFTQASAQNHGAPAINAQEVLEHTLANLKNMIEENQAEITYGPLPMVNLPDFQLEQLFQNIVWNAIRYRSAAPPRIHVAAEQDEVLWKFSIQDNGIGIKPEYKEEIFGMFKRLHTAAEYPGTGMGLAICQRIVEGVGGRMWVESDPSRGSTFFFTLPGPGVA
jgi:light-regulated signal transduction histidine kinase (bacteriophytochrome)